MIIANFKNDSHPIVYGASQWNYGEVLRIQGLNLPKAVEIHFSLEKTAGQAIPRIGTTKDGVTDVVIPDSLLENEGELQDYFVYVWIYLTDATSGRTEHSLSIKVKARSKPEIPGGDDNADPFREAIEEVNSAADRAEESERQAAEHAEQTKTDVQKTTADRQEVEKLVESVSGIGEQVETVKEYKDQAQTAASNAVLSEQASEQAKEAALQAQAGAESAADEAEQHALEVEGDKSEVERLATQVRQDKSSVEQTVQGFTSTAQQAIQSVQSAGTQAVGEVNTTKTDAVKAVQTEGTKQAEAVQAKGQEVINSIPSDYTTQMATKLDKQQGTENAGKALVIGEDGNVVPGEVESSGTQTLKLLSTIDITQQVNKVQCDFPGEYDVYYVFGNCFIPEESSGTIVLYQNIKTTEGVGYIKFYDTYGNKGKTLNVSLEFKRKKKEDGSCIIKMSGMYTISTYVTGQVVNVIDTGWINKDNGGKKILKYTGISLSALIKSGHLEIYGGV